MKKLFTSLAIGGATLIPFIAFAQDATDLGLKAIKLLNLVLLILLALAFLYFVWGVMAYVTKKDPKEKEGARSNMIYGLIGLFVIFSAWGLVRILQATVFTDGDAGGGIGECPSGELYNPLTGYCDSFEE